MADDHRFHHGIYVIRRSGATDRRASTDTRSDSWITDGGAFYGLQLCDGCALLRSRGMNASDRVGAPYRWWRATARQDAVHEGTVNTGALQQAPARPARRSPPGGTACFRPTAGASCAVGQ